MPPVFLKSITHEFSKGRLRISEIVQNTLLKLVKMKKNYLNKKQIKMRNLFYSESFLKSWNKEFQHILTLSFVMLFSMFSLVEISAQCLTINKTLVGVSSASSGIAGNIDATYDIEIINSGCGFVSGINVWDDASHPSNFGTAFVRSVGVPTTIYLDAPIPNKDGIINLSYTGVNPNDNLTTGIGFLFLGERVVYRVVFELNPRAAGAPASLGNSALVFPTIPVGEPQIASAPAVLPNCWSNCQMACNNNIQVSVNSSCEADILSAMVLEGEDPVCADLGFYQVTITYNNQVVSLPLGPGYIGKKLTVTARNIVCGNSCWGNLLLEDKTPPALTCLPRDTFRCNVNLDPAVFGFPVNPAFVNTSVYPYIVTGVDACGSVSLTYRDSVVSYTCTNAVLSATIYRRWCAKDAGGYESCCTDTIDLQRGTIGDITLPPHFDGQPGNYDALKCGGAWKKFPNGNPDTSTIVFDGLGLPIGGTGRPSGIFCGNIQFEFSDDTIRVCQGSFKLLRRWLIIDWCNPNNRVNYIQLIKVVDEDPPVVTNCPDIIEISTNAHACNASYILPAPQNFVPGAPITPNVPLVFEACSGWTYDVAYLPALDPNNCVPDPNAVRTKANIVKLPDGRYRVDNLQLGCNWIYYTICDGCGNCTECTFDIQVVDRTPPVAVCQQQTVIGLTANGLATVSANVFNQGSNDNCGMGSFKIRRMSSGPCGVSGTTPADSIRFCCADIARSPITIILTVIDNAGNSSECMAQVMVQDKLPPRITCPRDTVVYCETDISNLSVFGNAAANDNCSVNITQRIESSLNNCNYGTIKRWFIATDDGGRKDSCFQTITVRDTGLFRLSDITFPADIVLTGCRGDVSPEVTGKPIFRNRDRCNQIIANYKDLDFNFVEGVCHKILRTWTVIDWCQYDVHNPDSSRGIWSRVQVIKISESRLPDFTSSCDNRELCILTGCSVTGNFSATATDNCTDQQDLQWAYRLDRNNDNSIDLSGSGRNFSANLQEGIHRVTFIVTDLCGNSATCSYLVTARDCKAPTPYCVAGIVTVIMPSTGTVDIWAKDFNAGSFDNCTDTVDLKFSFSSNVNDISRRITCADLPNGREARIEVSMYVTDDAGNQEVCRTTVIVQDNQNICPDNLNGSEVAGLVTVSNKSIAQNVSLQVTNDANGEIKETITDEQGKYAFFDLAVNESYTLKPAYDDQNYLQGVTTKDIVAIQKHILAVEPLSNYYKMIAADVNKSESITASDITEIRKLILGYQEKFQKTQSWEFVDAEFGFNPAAPFKYPNHAKLNNLQKNKYENNFVAIKIGDVTGEAVTGNLAGSSSRSNKVFGFELDAVSAKSGDLIKVPVYASSNVSSFEGFQVEFVSTDQKYQIEGLESAAFEMNAQHFVTRENVCRISWNEQRSYNVNSGELLFYFLVRVNTDLNNEHLNFNLSTSFNSEAYSTHEDYNINLLFRSTDNNAAKGQYELYQNVPNPFSGRTTIHYKVPKSELVKISLFDMSGKMIKSMNYKATLGLNIAEIAVDSDYSGIIYYQLETNDFIATRKMVVIK